MKKYAKYIALAVTLALLALIFYFSGQRGAVSYKLSETVMNTVESGKAKVFVPVFFDAANLHANLRKWAHVYIYCALGVSMAVTVHLWTVKLPLWQKLLLSAALCMVCAIGDEVHQCFVPDRAGLLSDVGIDALGFLPCVAAVYLVVWRLRK